jgi:uncharacterized protein YdaU (DUF1376 family)
MKVRHLYVAPDVIPTSKLFYYPVKVGDFLTETLGWPWDAVAGFHALRLAQWAMGALPADPEHLRKLVRASRGQWRTAWRYLEPKFPLVGKGRRNSDVEAERQRALEQIERRRAGAEKTNRMRGTHRGPDDVGA